MTETRKRGDPFDGLSGLLAAWIAIESWRMAMTGEGGAPPTLAVDAVLIIAGLMTARAARSGLFDWSDLPRFLFWRSLRVAPAIFAGAALFLVVETALSDNGAPGDGGFVAANGQASILFAILLGSLVFGVAAAAGALRGAIGRAGLAALIAACMAARATPEAGLGPAGGEAARFAAAFALGAFLDSLNASGRVARSLRRLKLNNGTEAEAGALILMIAVIALSPPSVSIFAPVFVAGSFAIFLRKRDRVTEDVLTNGAVRKLGEWSMPLISGCFLLTWPMKEAVRAGLIESPDVAVILLAPAYLLAVIGLAGAFRRLVEDPARDFAGRCADEIALVRESIASERR